VDAILVGTVSTAEEDSVHLHTVTEDPAATMRACGRQSMDGTLKAIEDMNLTFLAHLKTFIIFVAANLTFGQLSSFGRELLICIGFHS
jgi:hypothetical protein